MFDPAVSPFSQWHILCYTCDNVSPAICRKPTQLLQHGVLLKDSIMPYYHHGVKDLLQEWEILLYVPDLAPCDVFLFSCV